MLCVFVLISSRKDKTNSKNTETTQMEMLCIIRSRLNILVLLALNFNDLVDDQGCDFRGLYREKAPTFVTPKSGSMLNNLSKMQ